MPTYLTSSSASPGPSSGTGRSTTSKQSSVTRPCGPGAQHDLPVRSHGRSLARRTLRLLMSGPLTVPLEVDELTAEWFSDCAGRRRRARRGARPPLGHDGPRARSRCTAAPGYRQRVFVKLPPFDAAQRVFVNQVGMGVTEARFFRDLAGEVGVRVPKPLLRDVHRTTTATSWCSKTSRPSGCRFPSQRRRRHRVPRATSSSSSPCCTRAYWESPRFDAGGDLAWIAPKGTGARRRRREVRADGRRRATPTGCPTASSRSPSSTSHAHATSCRCTARASARSCTATRTSATCSSTANAPGSSTGR